MANLPSSRLFVQTESTTTRNPVSENLIQTIGGSVNFLISTQRDSLDWCLNGTVTLFSGKTAVDGLKLVPNDQLWTIVDVSMSIGGVIGVAGQTEFDIKVAANNSNAFTSIFTTTPYANTSADTYSCVNTGTSPTGWRTPVLTTNPLNLNPGDKLRLDVISTMTGNSGPYSIQIYYRARSS